MTTTNYTLGFSRLTNLTKRQRRALNVMFIELPLNEIHQAQKEYLENLTSKQVKAL